MKKSTYILFGFILLKFILQYVLIGPEYELHRDEYLYLDQANHLAWGFFSVPPVTSWFSLVIKLLGNHIFWIKFFPALFGALTILVVWKTIEALDGGLFALLLGATSVLFSALLRLNILFQPNSLDVLCWITLYYFVIQYLRSEKPVWLYLGAVAFAIGFLNKYNIGFLVAGLFPALLVTQQRRIFLVKHLYFAILLGLLLISPNLMWQYTHHFPVVTHLRELASTQLVNVARMDFLTNQLLFFTGSLLVIIAGLYGLLFFAPFKKYRSFFWAFLFTLAIYTYLKAKGYYAIGIYPVYIAFGSVFLAAILQHGWTKYLRPVALALPVIFFIPLYFVAFPNKSPEYILTHEQPYKELGLLRWEDGRNHPLPQDFADMQGWKELARKTDSIYANIKAPGNTLVLCDNYGQAGAINYFTKEGIRAVSFNADYINWFNLDVPYRNLIRIKNRSEKQYELADTAPYFEDGYLADSISNPYAREEGAAIFVFTGAKIDVNKRIKEEIVREQNER